MIMIIDYVHKWLCQIKKQYLVVMAYIFPLETHKFMIVNNLKYCISTFHNSYVWKFINTALVEKIQEMDPIKHT